MLGILMEKTIAVLVTTAAIACTEPIQPVEDYARMLQIGNAFLAGECSIDFIDIYDIAIPTGEPDRRYRTEYTFLDVNDDNIPELHVSGGCHYYIFSIQNGQPYLFWDYYNIFIPILLNDGTMVHYNYGRWSENDWGVFCFDDSGEEKMIVSFSQKDMDSEGNGRYDEEDEYVYDGEVYSLEEWTEKVSEYLYFNENGMARLKNEADWQIYCEYGDANISTVSEPYFQNMADFENLSDKQQEWILNLVGEWEVTEWSMQKNGYGYNGAFTEENDAYIGKTVNIKEDGTAVYLGQQCYAKDEINIEGMEITLGSGYAVANANRLGEHIVISFYNFYNSQTKESRFHIMIGEDGQVYFRDETSGGMYSMKKVDFPIP